MNERMRDLLDRLQQREREEEPGYMEILPPLQAEIEQRSDFEPRRRSPFWAAADAELVES